MKLAFTTAIVALFVALGALSFAILSKNRLVEIEDEFRSVEAVEEKIGNVEARVGDLDRELAQTKGSIDSMRGETQKALNSVGDEIGAVRAQFKGATGAASGMEKSYRELRDRLLALEKEVVDLQKQLQEVEVKVPSAEPVVVEAPKVVAEEEEEASEDRSVDRTVEQIYKIRSGDTFSMIAQKYGVPLHLLLAANPEVDPKRLQIGQEIQIPAQVD